MLSLDPVNFATTADRLRMLANQLDDLYETQFELEVVSVVGNTVILAETDENAEVDMTMTWNYRDAHFVNDKPGDRFRLTLTKLERVELDDNS